MNALDIIIAFILIISMYIGVKKGFLKGIISLIGISLIAFISFLFRDNLADIMLKVCPFFNFSGAYKGITSLNILIYEGIAFILIFVFLFSFLAIILKITGLIQKIIDISVVLTLPSKLLGILVGLINGLVIVFILLFIMLNINPLRKHVYNSYISKEILENVSVLSKSTTNNYLAYEEINETIKSCKDEDNKNVCNTNIANTLIKYDIISKEDVEELVLLRKLKGIDRKDLISYD